MKTYKILTISLLTFFAIAFVACEKDDENGVSPSSSLTDVMAFPGYGEVSFSWKHPNDENLYYVDIDFVDSKGNTRSWKVSKFAKDTITGMVNTTITGFTNEENYVFTLTPCNKQGARGNSIQVSCKPKAPVFDIILKNIVLTEDFGGIRIDWLNDTEKEATIKIKYQNHLNNELELKSIKATPKGHDYIFDLTDKPTGFTVSVQDADYNESNIKSFTLTPRKEIEFDKSNFSIPGYLSGSWEPTIGYSSQAINEGSQNKVISILDNNTSTYWHASYSPGTQYPHWIIVDLGKEITISRVSVQRRLGDARGETGHQFLTCTEGNAKGAIPKDDWRWDDQGKYIFDPAIDAKQSSRLENNPRARYLQIYMSPEFKGQIDMAMISEIYVYGDEN